MSFFQSAHNFTIAKLNITSSSQIPQECRAAAHTQNPCDILYGNSVPGATHDSSERSDAPKCQPETRTAVQEEIVSWITTGDDDAQPSKILWLTGPAGSGKTAIAGSLAEICEERDLLAASFFISSFAGSPARRSKRGVVGTLAYQLSQIDGYGPLREEILAAIETHPAIFDKHLKSQLDAIVLRPLREVGNSHGQLLTSRRVIIVDGLDEILTDKAQGLNPDSLRQANEDDQIEVLSTLLHAANDPNFPFRIIVSSRPERVIRQFFSAEAKPISRELFLDEKYSPDSDITLFLQANFSELRRRYTLPPSWPGSGVVSTLVRNASGQFIYAATIVRFLRSGTIPPHVRMRFVSTLQCDDKDADPFASLDALYHHILNSSPQPLLAIQWISIVSSRLSDSSALFTKQLLQEYPGQGDYLLENLASLVWLLSSGTQEPLYKVYHKSLLDFLGDPQRCGADFHHAYQSAVQQLLFPRCAHVFQKQAPIVPVNGEKELTRFHDQFITNLSRVCGVDYVEWERSRSSTTPEIPSLWSMHTSILNFASLFPTREAILSRQVSTLFQLFHQECHERNSPGCCTPMCRYWRSRILHSCQALGWDTPSASHLLRELMYEGWLHRCGPGALPGPRNRIDMFTGDFSPPEKPISPPFHPVIAHFAAPNQSHTLLRSPIEMVSPALGSACDSDHEALLKLVNAVYSSLSEDWHHQFEVDLARDVMVQQVFRGHVDRICWAFITGNEQSEANTDHAEDILRQPEPVPSPTTSTTQNSPPSPGVKSNAGAPTLPDREAIHPTSNPPTLHQQPLTPQPQRPLEPVSATPRNAPNARRAESVPAPLLGASTPRQTRVRAAPSSPSIFLQGPSDAHQASVVETGRRQSTRRRKQAEMGPKLVAGGRRSPEGRKPSWSFAPTSSMQDLAFSDEQDKVEEPPRKKAKRQ
ncbi:hypothetical protein FA13DRAFT_1725792 [Coprinellus micaceus]|uniref:NACHT domain-containing protein n=1 Tax=Coprinellus micaceus TaxID=71717 RepID=A0A4Y7TVG4_COPMI|nr:hypothetical protein FA13DRAFT_1725792 [Coprinellus micaceus]